jgi:hypothetical protein
LKFVFDENFAPNLARALALLDNEHEVASVVDKYGRGLDDIDWIPRLADEDENWVILTIDKRISRNKKITEVWKQAGLTTFFFVGAWAHTSSWDRIVKTIGLWKNIVEKACQAKRGSVFKVLIKSKEIVELK